MNEPVFYRGGGFAVSERLLRTRRRTYTLARIEYVSVTRPLLLLLGGPAIGALGVAASFRRYLHAEEIAVIAGISVVALLLSVCIGTLRVHSLALRGEEGTQTLGPVWRLRRVRRAVEQAMTLRNHEETRP